MNIAFRKSFTRGLKKIRDSAIIERIRKSIKAVESARVVHEIPECKKLAGSDDCFRIRIGEYRIGAAV